jgi:alpha-1,3-mannosyltransferase
MRIIIRTCMRTRGAFNYRIEYLAEVRNAAFVPLHELRDSENDYFDTIIFMNDILPAGMTCASDYMYHEDIGSLVFYDNWVARDINGTALENAPFERIFHPGVLAAFSASSAGPSPVIGMGLKSSTQHRSIPRHTSVSEWRG